MSLHLTVYQQGGDEDHDQDEDHDHNHDLQMATMIMMATNANVCGGKNASKQISTPPNDDNEDLRDA